MFKRSNWLEKYGLVPKIFLVLAFFVYLGGLDLIVFFREVMNTPTPKPRFKFYYALMPRQKTEWQEWKDLKAEIDPQLEQIYQEARAKGTAYGPRSYLLDLVKLQKLEEKYDMELVQDIRMTMELQALWVKNAHLRRLPAIEDDESAIEEVRKQTRNYIPPAPKEEMYADLQAFLFWLLLSYFKLMFFWGLIYVIRFQERKTAEFKVRKHCHSRQAFYNSYELYPGELSLRNELILCPFRFFCRMIFWPFFCMKYPFYETTAEMIRYNRLKAEFLRYKPIGYQLNPQEDAILRSKAKKSVKNFEQAIASTFELPVLVRRSAYIGYLSLIFGVLFQPALALAASYSQKVDAHFYGQGQLSLVEHEKDSGDQIRDGTGQPGFDNQSSGDWLAMPERFCLDEPVGLISWLQDKPLIKLKELFFGIDPVPRLVVLAARCL